MSTTWVVQRTASARFPFRIIIERDGKTLLAVRAQSSWPGPGQQIFCLREDTLDPDEPLDTTETVTVLHYTQIGRKLTIGLPMVFAGNRKLANRFAAQYFAACSGNAQNPQLSLVSEEDASYHVVPVEQQIRDAVVGWPAESFPTADVAARFPSVAAARVRRVLEELAVEGLLERTGQRRGLRWRKPAPP